MPNASASLTACARDAIAYFIHHSVPNALYTNAKSSPVNLTQGHRVVVVPLKQLSPHFDKRVKSGFPYTSEKVQ